MDDIYATPEAELNNNNPSEHLGGTIEDAIAGKIKISMMDTLGEAWSNVKGFKLSCHIAFAIYFVVAMVAVMISIPLVSGLNMIGADQSVIGIFAMVVQMAVSIATMAMFYGIHIMGIRHIADKSVSSGTILQYFDKIPRLFLCYFVMTFMIIIGMLLLVLPGIYLIIAYMFAMALIVEKDMPVWQALETSRKAITKNWFQMFGILLVIMLINLLAVFTLGIAWIWVVPWSILTMSLVHIKLFGAEPHTLVD